MIYLNGSICKNIHQEPVQGYPTPLPIYPNLRSRVPVLNPTPYALSGPPRKSNNRLAVVKKIVDMHGGTIAVTNRACGGARVVLSFGVDAVRDAEAVAGRPAEGD